MCGKWELLQLCPAFIPLDYHSCLQAYALGLQVESNGTVLSTNWQDVGSKKVEGSPPDGMELKKWEY